MQHLPGEDMSVAGVLQGRLQSKKKGGAEIFCLFAAKNG